MKAILLATLSFCLLGVSNADAHARHHHHHHVKEIISQPDYAYPVDNRYAHLNTGAWVYHERGPKALYEWQRHSRVQQIQPVAFASLSPVAYGTSRPSNCSGIPWCGCWLKSALGNVLSAADRALNLNRAIEWAHVGQAARPHVGAIVVWSHHVGTITGQDSNGQWIITSGNDGHAVRSRPRSLAGVVAIRSV